MESIPRMYRRSSTLLSVLFCTILSGFCNAKELNSCFDQQMSVVFSTYEIVGVVKYKGGLTTEDDSKSRIGEHVAILADSFTHPAHSISNPSYKMICERSRTTEGDIGRERRWSTYYMHGVGREIIQAIEVYDSNAPFSHAHPVFEIVGDELWELADGWMYIMKRSIRFP